MEGGGRGGGEDAATETVETETAEEKQEIWKGAPEEGKKKTEAQEEGKKETEAQEEKVEKAKEPKKEAEALPDVVARFFQNNPTEACVYLNRFGGLFSTTTPKHLLAKSTKYNNPLL